LRYSDSGKQVVSTIGEFVESLLGKDKYFSSPLPRIPVKVRQMLERELAPLHQYRKRMEANQKLFRTKRIQELPVEVSLDSGWVAGVAKEFVGRAQARRKVRVQLDDGTVVTVHMGKVVLQKKEDDKSGDESGDGSDDEGKSRRRRRSRSPDWSYYKGRSDKDMVEDMREKAKQDAVCGQGKSYSRRPLTVEEELWKREPDSRVSMLGEGEERGGAHSSGTKRGAGSETSRDNDVMKRLRREEEQEHKKRMADIFQKYGSASKATSTTSAKSNDIDQPEVLRLG